MSEEVFVYSNGGLLFTMKIPASSREYKWGPS